MNLNSDFMDQIVPIQSSSSLQYAITLDPITFTPPGSSVTVAGFTAKNIADANVAAGFNANFGCLTDTDTGSIIFNPINQIALIAGAIKELASKLEKLDSKLANIEAKSASFVPKFADVDTTLASLTAKDIELTKRFEETDKKIQHINETNKALEEIKNDLSGQSKQVRAISGMFANIVKIAVDETSKVASPVDSTATPVVNVTIEPVAPAVITTPAQSIEPVSGTVAAPKVINMFKPKA